MRRDASWSGDLAGIVLAAGAGLRFGGPKALADLDGDLFVERAARTAAAGGCEPVIVVLGAAADEVVVAADLRAATVVVAADWETGMSASLRCGLAAARQSQAARAVVVLADQPWVGATSIIRLRAAWEAGAVAAVATYGGRPRNPVLLDRSVWDEVAASVAGDAGAREWLRAHRDLVAPVDCDGTGDPADVDTPADLGHEA